MYFTITMDSNNEWADFLEHAHSQISFKYRLKNHKDDVLFN